MKFASCDYLEINLSYLLYVGGKLLELSSVKGSQIYNRFNRFFLYSFSISSLISSSLTEMWRENIQGIQGIINNQKVTGKEGRVS